MCYYTLIIKYNIYSRQTIDDLPPSFSQSTIFRKKCVSLRISYLKEKEDSATSFSKTLHAHKSSDERRILASREK